MFVSPPGAARTSELQDGLCKKNKGTRHPAALHAGSLVPFDLQASIPVRQGVPRLLRSASRGPRRQGNVCRVSIQEKRRSRMGGCQKVSLTGEPAHSNLVLAFKRSDSFFQPPFANKAPRADHVGEYIYGMNHELILLSMELKQISLQPGQLCRCARWDQTLRGVDQPSRRCVGVPP
jgi:hypothetical protein